MSFPLDQAARLPEDQASVPSERDLPGGARLLFCLELPQVRAGSPLTWADNGAEAL